MAIAMKSNRVHRHVGISRTTQFFAAVLLLNIPMLLFSTLSVSKWSTDVATFQETMGAFRTTSAERNQEQEEKTDTISLSTETFESQKAKPPATRKWAYAFLVGNAGPTERSEYFAGLTSVMAIGHELRKLGSKADIILMIQISTHSPLTKLPNFEEELLQKMNIRIAYVPKFAKKELEGFYSLMNEKFRILELEEYSRIMYLDYDVFPFCNLDYLFELSEPLVTESANATKPGFQLKENVILAYKLEPSSGGIFILKPNISDFDRLQRIIHEKEIRSYHQPYPHWDETYGWGHVITPPDSWKILRGWKQQNWTWYGSWADQGLLYYWTKYVQQSVSIIVRDTIEQWDKDNWILQWDGKLVLNKDTFDHEAGEIKTILKGDPFKKYGYGCPKIHLLPNPYDDFKHMSGANKPWYKQLHELENPPDCKKDKSQIICMAQVRWYNSLKEALASIKHLDNFPWDRTMGHNAYDKKNAMGNTPGHELVRDYLQNLQKNGWKLYAEDTHQRITISAIQ